MPNRLSTTLRFAKEVSITNGGLIYTNVRFTWTNVYDIDPVLGSSACPGFSELGGIYRFYRAKASRCKLVAVNLDNIGAVVYLCPVNFDPGLNTINYQNYVSNRRAKLAPLGGTSGNSIATISASCSLQDFAGLTSQNTSATDTYCGATSGATNPTNNVFWATGAVYSAAMTNGVYITVLIDVDVDFFELSAPTT